MYLDIKSDHLRWRLFVKKKKKKKKKKKHFIELQKSLFKQLTESTSHWTNLFSIELCGFAFSKTSSFWLIVLLTQGDSVDQDAAQGRLDQTQLMRPRTCKQKQRVRN